jgi:2-oxo-4-hydroxy-4-carboxy--5-ureidoimidazoline (OHCU) decarboxylase
MPPGPLPAVSDLDALSCKEFLTAIHPLFEGGEALGKRLWAVRPFTSYRALLDRAEQLCAELDDGEKVEVVNSHPRLGESPEALQRLSRQSYEEQGYDSAEPETERAARQELQLLNRDYEDRFGFRFVIFVAGRRPSELLAAMRQRMGRERRTELAEALLAVFAIARERLGKWRQSETREDPL